MQNKQQIAQRMNLILADIYALYLKTQNYHWNVEGSNFYSLHLLLEKQYQEQAEAIDEFAEKIRTLDSFVEANLSFFNEKSSLSQPKSPIGASEMLKDLVIGHEAVIKYYRELSDLAIEKNNKSIEDFCVQRIQAHEQQRWMLLSSTK